jgi:hypothetical protein
MGLGKRLKVGEVFESVSKKHLKEDFSERWYRKKGRLYRKGDKDYFIKGKRRYFCEVLGISETKTGLHCWNTAFLPGAYVGPRYWQFTYVVKIIEN